MSKSPNILTQNHTFCAVRESSCVAVPAPNVEFVRGGAAGSDRARDSTQVSEREDRCPLNKIIFLRSPRADLNTSPPRLKAQRAIPTPALTFSRIFQLPTRLGSITDPILLRHCMPYRHIRRSALFNAQNARLYKDLKQLIRESDCFRWAGGGMCMGAWDCDVWCG